MQYRILVWYSTFSTPKYKSQQGTLSAWLGISAICTLVHNFEGMGSERVYEFGYSNRHFGLLFTVLCVFLAVLELVVLLAAFRPVFMAYPETIILLWTISIALLFLLTQKNWTKKGQGYVREHTLHLNLGATKHRIPFDEIRECNTGDVKSQILLIRLKNGENIDLSSSHMFNASKSLKEFSDFLMAELRKSGKL